MENRNIQKQSENLTPPSQFSYENEIKKSVVLLVDGKEYLLTAATSGGVSVWQPVLITETLLDSVLKTIDSTGESLTSLRSKLISDTGEEPQKPSTADHKKYGSGK